VTVAVLKYRDFESYFKSGHVTYILKQVLFGMYFTVTYTLLAVAFKMFIWNQYSYVSFLYVETKC
jgi:hypothetical protein